MSKKYLLNLFCLVIFSLLGVPISINRIMIWLNKISIDKSHLFANELTNKEWLAFFGSYLGGVATLISILIMYYMNKEILISQKKSTEYSVEKENLKEIKNILVSCIGSFDIQIFFKFLKLGSNIDLKEQKMIFILAQEEVTKNQTLLEISTEINEKFEIDNKVVDERNILIIKIKNLRDKYYKLNAFYYESLQFFLNQISIMERDKKMSDKVYKSISDKISKDISEISDLSAHFKISCKEYILAKEQIIRKNHK